MLATARTTFFVFADGAICNSVVLIAPILSTVMASRLA